MTTYVYEFPSAGGGPKFFINDGWVYSVSDGRPAYWIKDGWWYTASGEPRFWVSDRYVYEHPGAGSPPRYFLS
jgi:hypothetical protein